MVIKLKIFILRHGESEENLKGTFYGTMDCGLSENGVLQAINIKERLEGVIFDCAYYSPMKRVKETLNIVVDGESNTTLLMDQRIKELDFGDFEGKTYDEILKAFPKECKEWNHDWKGFTPPKGESYIDLYNRVESFMDEVLKSNHENILIVTHGGVMRAIYTYVMNGNLDLFWKFGCNNCDLARINYEYGNLYIDSIYHYKETS